LSISKTKIDLRSLQKNFSISVLQNQDITGAIQGYCSSNSRTEELPGHDLNNFFTIIFLNKTANYTGNTILNIHPYFHDMCGTQPEPTEEEKKRYMKMCEERIAEEQYADWNAMDFEYGSNAKIKTTISISRGGKTLKEMGGLLNILSLGDWTKSTLRHITPASKKMVCWSVLEKLAEGHVDCLKYQGREKTDTEILFYERIQNQATASKNRVNTYLDDMIEIYEHMGIKKEEMLKYKNASLKMARIISHHSEKKM